MSNKNLSNYQNHDGTGAMLLSACVAGGVGWILCGAALISVVGIVFLPVLIPATLFASGYVKRRNAASGERSQRAFEAAGFKVTRTIEADRGVFLIDEERKAFAFWVRGPLNFTPGIALFSEVVEVGFVREGSIVREVAPGLTHSTNGATEFAIKFDRLDQPMFTFQARSAAQAERLMQQFEILTS